MKRPIEVTDIRKGDLIRAEWQNGSAREYRVNNDRHGDWIGAKPTHFLLDRPTPAVELPTEPTFGLLVWATGSGGTASRWDVWEHRHDDYLYGQTQQINVPNERITAFTPATAVPNQALYELRKGASRAFSFSGPYDRAATYREVVSDFIAAVDEASA